MSQSASEMEQLVADIYGAGLGEKNWRNVLQTLERQLPGVAFAMWGHDLLSWNILDAITVGYDPQFMETYFAHYGTKNAWADGIARTPVGQTVAPETCFSREELVQTEFYNDWLKPQEDISTGAGVPLFRSDDRFVALSANVRLKDETRLNAKVFKTLQAISPHLHRAYALNRSLREGMTRKDLERVLSVLSTAVFVLDGTGRAIYANPAAQKLLNEQGLLTLTPKGNPLFRDRAVHIHMERLNHSLVTKQLLMTALEFLATDTITLAKYSVTIVPVLGLNEIDEELARLDQPGRAAVAMHIALTHPSQKQIKSVLARRFGLSPTECELIWLLFEGHEPTGIAEQRQVSIHTVRNQIKAIYAKTDRHRVGDLVRLVAETQIQFHMQKGPDREYRTEPFDHGSSA